MLESFQVYKDMEGEDEREIYRGSFTGSTGKSTFIKRFMDLLVLSEYDRYTCERTDEAFQLSRVCFRYDNWRLQNRKFVPKEAAG